MENRKNISLHMFDEKVQFEEVYSDSDDTRADVIQSFEDFDNSVALLKRYPHMQCFLHTRVPEQGGSGGTHSS